jgi:hypothetical protein
LLARHAGVGAFASTGTYGFAKLSKIDATSSFARIRLATGAVDELIPQLGDGGVQLAIGDRVYLLDRADSDWTLRSFSVEGTDLRIEQTIEPRSVGAYAGGTYYLSRVEAGDASGATDTLYFRPNFASDWKPIRQREAADTTTLWGSSSHGVVYVEPDTNGADQLYLLQGSELVPHGPLPANAIEALPTGKGITVLTHDEYAPLNELWWLDAGEEPIRYAVSPDGLSPRMRVYRDIVVLLLTEGNSGYVERFDANGAIGGRIGVRLGSDLLGLDDEYLFHEVTDDWFSWRVLRTSWGVFGQ